VSAQMVLDLFGQEWPVRVPGAPLGAFVGCLAPGERVGVYVADVESGELVCVFSGAGAACRSWARRRGVVSRASVGELVRDVRAGALSGCNGAGAVRLAELRSVFEACADA